MIRRALAILVAGAVVIGSGCAQPEPSAEQFAEQLAQRVTVDAMYADLVALQHIADNNGGNRAFGTGGYEASADYIAQALRSKGFEVSDTPFDVAVAYADTPVFRVAGQAVRAESMHYTLGTVPSGINAPLVPVPDTGCLVSDYGGLKIVGSVALVNRTGCSYEGKEAIAAKLGAAALVIADDAADEPLVGSLGPRTEVQIPVIGIGKADGDRLRERPGPATLVVTAGVRNTHTHNVIAQTRTGSTRDVVMVGAHLDSVRKGPGINDNGSGVAAVLQTALQLGSAPPVHNAVRFAFWSGEEIGDAGSKHYVQSLDLDGLKDIALYLNFDMIASPNPGYFTYDGDQSGPLTEGGPPVRIPEGAAGIERTLVGYLNSTPKKPEDASFDGRSDDQPFAAAGIPAGGLESGSDEIMTEEQARRWGGAAGRPFDPNYHKKSDTVEHIDHTALEILGRGVAFAVGSYAQDVGGRNGVPARPDRTRHLARTS